MSLMLWPVRTEKHPPIPGFAKLRLKAAPAEVGIAVIGNGTTSIRITKPVTAAPVAVLCARSLDNVSHAQRDAHDFAFEALVSRIR
jgi:hypothetical protein